MMAAVLWWVSKAGQQLGRGQMEVLKDAVEGALK